MKAKTQAWVDLMANFPVDTKRPKPAENIFEIINTLASFDYPVCGVRFSICDFHASVSVSGTFGGLRFPLSLLPVACLLLNPIAASLMSERFWKQSYSTRQSRPPTGQVSP
jgi:hypothetical protein